MTDETLVIDVAWTKPKPNDVLAAGYSGVIGYISHDAGKDLGARQAKAYLKAGLKVALVFETIADEATRGESAGVADRKYAEHRARSMGYPRDCPIFYAVDVDVPPAAVLSYFAGVMKGAQWRSGPYGSARVVAAVLDKHTNAVAWQTVAWSGSVVVHRASIYQRNTKTARKIAGVASNSYDENVIMRPVKLWGGELAPPAAHEPTHKHDGHGDGKPPAKHHKHRAGRTPANLLRWIRRTKAKAIGAAVASATASYLITALQAGDVVTVHGLEVAAGTSILAFITAHRLKNHGDAKP